MLKHNKKIIADVMILISAILWGGEYAVVKSVLNYMESGWINAVRFLFSAFIMFFIFNKKIRNINYKTMLGGTLLGLSMFGGFILQTVGLLYTTAGKSGFVTSIYVVMVPFWVWILKKKFPGFKLFICLAILITGIFLLSFEGLGKGFNKGDLMTIAAAFCFSINIILVDYYAKHCETISLTFAEMLSAGIFCIIYALLVETTPDISYFGAKEFIQLIYIIIFGSFICHLLSNTAMEWAEPSHASILWSLESVFALIFGIIFLGESLTSRMIIGFIFVFTAVMMTEIKHKALNE